MRNRVLVIQFLKGNQNVVLGTRVQLKKPFMKEDNKTLILFM